MTFAPLLHKYIDNDENQELKYVKKQELLAKFYSEFIIKKSPQRIDVGILVLLHIVGRILRA